LRIRYEIPSPETSNSAHMKNAMESLGKNSLRPCLYALPVETALSAVVDKFRSASEKLIQERRVKIGLLDLYDQVGVHS